MHEDDSDSNSSSLEDLNRLAPEQKPLKIEPNVPEKISRGINLNVMRQKKPRLVIDHMVLQDFKSYAGRQVIGKFHGNFTSVVGPNGSGKSNLIESMLFIFGFNASWMRLNKLNQLIHNSSTSTGNNKAAVEVHFKKLLELPNGELVEVPGFELWIRRTVNSSSVSKYYLQGHESTQAEVKDKLKAEGIDLGNNRFLILQGEVEQISQMKQKSGDRDKPGLLEYLEEIIGSGLYIERIEECGREYAQAEEQKHEKGQLMKLVQNELRGMSKAKDEAVRYVKKEKKIYQIQNVYNQVLCSTTREDAKKHRQQLADFQKARDRIVGEERQRLKTQAERIRDIRKNKQDQEELQKNLDKYQETCNKLQVEDKHITQQIAYKSEDLVKFERKAQEADKEMSRIISQCEEIREKLPSSKQALSGRNTALEAMRTELSKYQKPQLRQKIKDCEVEISRNELESSNLQSKLENVKQVMNKAKMGKGDLQAKLKDYQIKMHQTMEIRQKIEKAKSIAEKIIKQKKQKVFDFNRQRDQLRNQMRKIQSDLREHMNQNEEQGQMGNMFRQIMAQNFPGVIGRLGDLGEVSRDHDQVITTCCNRLDNIVVTDLPTASAVLDFLKARRLGRATCIILDKIADHRHYMNRPFENLPQAVRLFDLVKFKTEEAKIAFYFALNDTLYCENSDLGLQYSMKNESQRRRVICKNKNRSGYITYEMNGLMVGSMSRKGGFIPKASTKNKAKSQGEGQTKQIQARKKQIAQLMDEISKRLDKQDSELKAASQDLDQMKRELVSVTENIKEYEEQSKDLKDMLSKTDNRGGISSQSREREIQDLSKQIARFGKIRAELEKKLKSLEDEQKQGEAESVVKLRDKYKLQKVEVNRLEKDFQKEKAILQNSLKRIQDVKKGKIESERRTESSKREIDKFKTQQVELEKKVSEIIGKMTAFEQKLKECKRGEIDLKKMMEEDEKEVRQSKAKVEKAKKDVETSQENCKRKDAQLLASQDELEKIRKDYRELNATYSFLDDLDEIEKMSLNHSDKNMQGPPSPRNNSSILQTSMLNSSLDTSQPRIFQVEQLLRTNPLQNLNEDQIEHFSYFKDKLFGMITAQSAEIKKMEGSNLEIIIEFKNKYGHYRERLREFEAVKQRQQELKRIIDKLKEQRLQLFRQGFGVINSKLKEVYQHLTRGGDAELQLIDALDPFSDGVNFSVRPPKKSWKEVNKLSGGEKTLSSLSLIFALHYYKPTPLYFMDQIDAALDFKNVSIVADYIKKRTKDAQFIIISLRNNMFDLANKLVGVYKTNDKTRVINLDPSRLLKSREQKQNQDRGNNIR